jgi:hypothetical protein
MGIGPIPSLRALPSIAPRGNDVDLPPVYEIKEFPRAGDETYNGNAKDSAGGQDDEESELLDEGSEAESADEASNNDSANQISFFA